MISKAAVKMKEAVKRMMKSGLRATRSRTRRKKEAGMKRNHALMKEEW